ncbi:unnamed protein product [Rhizoctonia solani]|uniref:DUF3835 domain-containing protein n=1 Tax=Rhizoctonia solani TaxID=456999 RepID=A0A8H3AN70_9AGAM|nr:unnamed protein product [Rhizoctonia solani]
MSTTAEGGEVRSMGASKQEALRALLKSLMPNGQMTLPDDVNVDKLAEKLEELLASKGGLEAYTNLPRDDQGRPLNEEGLPIMEIIEPVADTNESSATQPSAVDTVSPLISASGQAPLSPLPNWALSPAALAARRRERDRILDILEQEEEREFAREAAATHESTNRSSTTEPQPVPPTPPRTLDQAVWTSDPKNSRPPARSLSINSSSQENPRTPGDSVTTTPQDAPVARKPKKQKSVSFVDPPSNDQDDRPHTPKLELDWGDVIPVPLHSHKPGPTKGHSVMKELVVERPMTQSSATPNRTMDSDDEDEDEDEELNEAHDISEDQDSETEVPREALGQLETSEDESEVDREEATQSVDIDDTDFDEAMLQREIALAYYARRNQIGPDVSSGPLFDPTTMDRAASRDGDQDGSAEGAMKTNSTRFRGSRLPGDPQTLVNSAVQFGRLVDGELVANEIEDKEIEASVDALTGGGDVGQEDMTEKMIELLRRGDTYSDNRPATVEPKPSIKQILGEPSGSRLPTSESTPLRSTAKQQDVVRRFKSHINPAIAPPVPTSRASSQKLAVPPPPTSNQPMIIESGFGFDPAFQIAPPPKPKIAKAPAPMSKTVKERVMVPSPVVKEKKISRFAQARVSSQLQAPQQSASSSINTKAPPTMGSDVVERTPDPSSETKPSEPPKRMSRFRAERSGWM